MKIEKLFIKNFKNIKSSRIIDFQKNISLFVGPNGFGKTTIFDAIEILLTGNVSRVCNPQIADARNTFKTPYFQNDPNEDVLLKLLVKNSQNESLVIIRHLDSKEKRNKREHVPYKSFGLFQLYKGQTDSESFSKEEQVKNSQPLSQEEINSFLGFENENYKIENIYNLFNYLQQEETDFYIKKSEAERKNVLSFLLQIQDYESQKNKIGDLKDRFKKILEDLQKQKLEHSQSTHKAVDYQKINFIPDRDFEFNNIKINFGEKNSTEALDVYFEEVENLIAFKEYFSPKDYLIRKEKETFKREIIDNIEMISYLIFKKLIKDIQLSQNLEQEYLSVNNEHNVKAYLLENFLSKVPFLKEQTQRKNNLSSLAEIIHLDINFIDIRNTESLLKILKANTNATENFVKIFLEYKDLNSQLDGSRKDYFRVNDLRNQLKIHKVPDDNYHQKCVLCGYDWQNEEKLQLKYDELGASFEQNLSNLEKLVSRKRKEAEDILLKINEFIIREEKKLVIVDERILSELELLDVEESDFKIYKDFVTTQLSTIPFGIRSLSWLDYTNEFQNLVEAGKGKLQFSDILYEKFDFSRRHKEKFELLLAKYSSITKENLEEYQVSSSNLSVFKGKYSIMYSGILSLLENIYQNIDYNPEKCIDSKKIFKTYFDEDKKRFDSCTLEMLESKKEYILYQFELEQSRIIFQINSRIDKIKKLKDYLESRYWECVSNIKSYQSEIIDKLKLPFFLYTAKILQNYQQGMGVFLTTQEKNANIRFLANSYNDQDAMYQLSSGQIAIISFAFTLSLNTTFKISDDLKILIIDDPIQDMDAMNVYALIDMLRHSLLNYQIIMSTHSDSSAMFIKYKFDRMDSDSESKVDLINVKTLFLEGK
ncbi:AAA family ATPase [Pseudolactococcus raffinolactis]|uniref:AAA family ATPase n=1 Tax=Pseudolactococcus raffinolactis TaxID=1366 RepID=UPI001436CD3A|nr:AAA family ATPase [Lactococcus raffinolactis]QIW55334.1 AAA family ATPase [Lactococcus raffinolactis]